MIPIELRPARLDAVLGAAVASGRVPGVVGAVAGRSGTIYEGAFGTARQGAPMRLDTVFRIASMTKLVTALGVMMLREEGALDLDDPLARRLPEYRQPEVLVELDADSGEYVTRPAARSVTIRQLLANTSGYGYWFLSKTLRAVSGDDPSPLEAPFLLHEPGERFTYGIGTDVLGRMFLPVTGSALETFMEERLFGPLRMRSTGWRLPQPERLAALYVRRREGYAAKPTESEAAPPRGGGGLYGTAADYLTLLTLFLNGGEAAGQRLVGAASLQEIRRNQIGPLVARWQHTAAPQRTLDFSILDGTQKFGLGVAVETRDRAGGRLADSFGWGGIFNTFYWVDPRAGTAAVILMQMSPFCDPGCIALYREFETAVYGG